MCYELELRGLAYERQVALPLVYKGIELDCGYQMDVVVADTVVIELKAVQEVIPIYQAQLLTYLRLSGKKIGLLINFNVPNLMAGVTRRIL